MANPQAFDLTYDNGDAFVLVDDNDRHYIYLKPIIEKIGGLSWKRQLAKLRKHDEYFDYRDYVCDGQVYNCIALYDLAEFLGTIDPASVAPKVRKRLAYFRDEIPARIKKSLAKEEASDPNALVDILRAVGFDDGVLKYMGLLGA